MEYKLHVYKDADKILGVWAQDDSEYSAIYLVDGEGGGIKMASNLADINGEYATHDQWVQQFYELMVMFDEVVIEKVNRIPPIVMMQYEEWLALS